MTLVLAGAQSAWAQTVTPAPTVAAPTLFRLSGNLQTPTGEPRTGIVTLVAFLYNAQTDVTPLWSEAQTVTLDAAGHYSILVGATLDGGVPKEYFLDGSARWLGLAVQAEAEQPRIMLVTVPYALKALDADTLAGKTPADFVLNDGLVTTVKNAFKGVSADGTPIANVSSTTNVLAKFTDTVGTVGNSVVTELAGSIGVGTSSPARVLHLFNGSAATARMRMDSGSGIYSEFGTDSAATNFGAGIFFNTTQQAHFYGGGLSLGAYIAKDPPSQGLIVNGFVGIGTSTPQTALQVLGQSFIGPTASPSSHLILSFNNNGSNYAHFYDAGGAGTNGGVAIGGSTNLSAVPGAPAMFWNVNTNMVGIGTISPATVLHIFNAAVSGARMRMDSGGGIYTEFGTSSAASHFGAGIYVGATQQAHFYGRGLALGGFISTDPPADGLIVTGKVGIGVAVPTQALDVLGSINVSGNINAKYQDVAEWVETSSPLEAGTVVIVDPSAPNRVLRATKANDTRVAGAVSKQPGLILGEGSETKAMVAQSGRVRIKVDATYGAVKVGDLLVTSPTPGYAMRARPVKVGGQLIYRAGTILGKALEAMPNGKGEILVLLTLQ